MSTERISSYEEFWPFYLSEHRDTRSRRLHFLGTTGFTAAVVGSFIANPVGFGMAMAGWGLIMRDGLKKGEAERPSFRHVLGMLVLPTLASPVLYPAGVVFAYGCAWAGHFGFEKNEPATFKYPLWSLASDYKMYGEMVRGRLWSGDPLVELGLDDPFGGDEVISVTDAPAA